MLSSLNLSLNLLYFYNTIIAFCLNDENAKILMIHEIPSRDSGKSTKIKAHNYQSDSNCTFKKLALKCHSLEARVLFYQVLITNPYLLFG